MKERLSRTVSMMCSLTRTASLGAVLLATALAAVAAPETSRREPEPTPPPPGFNPYTAPSQRPVGPLRFGRGVGPDGVVPDSQRTDIFMPYDPIHISMSTSRLPVGVLARLTIYEEGHDLPVWRDAKSVTAQKSPLSFELAPGKLQAGRYRVVLILEGRPVAQQSFEVKTGSEERSVGS